MDRDRMSNDMKTVEKIIKSRAGVVYLEGQPGSGKTAVAEDIAKKNGWNYEQFILSQIDSADVGGIPKAVTILDDDGRQIDIMRYLTPEWAIEANKRPTLVNFDEINRAPLETRNAALQILNERRVGRYQLNDNVYFIATGNIGEDGTRSDGAEVEEMDSALWGRLVYFSWDLTIDDWKKSFADGKVWEEELMFLDAKPEFFFKRSESQRMNASARTWTNLSKYLDSACAEDDTFENRVAECKDMAKRYIGETAAAQFNRYLQEKMLININRVIEDWKDVKDIVTKFDRSRIAELANEFSKLEQEVGEMSKKHLSNFCDFVSECMEEDAIVGLLSNSVLADAGDISPKSETSKVGIYLPKMRKAGEGADDVWSKKIPKRDKNYLYILFRFYDVLFNDYLKEEGEKDV